jgi:hypothetical protein
MLVKANSDESLYKARLDLSFLPNPSIVSRRSWLVCKMFNEPRRRPGFTPRAIERHPVGVQGPVVLAPTGRLLIGRSVNPGRMLVFRKDAS